MSLIIVFMLIFFIRERNKTKTTVETERIEGLHSNESKKSLYTWSGANAK